MANFPPLVADFKAQFTREFVYSDGLDGVTDNDISRALMEAGIEFNPSLWDTTTPLVTGGASEGGLAYMYLSAHLMVRNVQGAGGLGAVPMGLGVNSRGGGVIETKAVGQVNLGYAVMDMARTSPGLSQYLETDFGKRYLEMIYPRLIANVAVVSGRSPWAFPGGQVP